MTLPIVSLVLEVIVTHVGPEHSSAAEDVSNIDTIPKASRADCVIRDKLRHLGRSREVSRHLRLLIRPYCLPGAAIVGMDLDRRSLMSCPSPRFGGILLFWSFSAWRLVQYDLLPEFTCLPTWERHSCRGGVIPARWSVLVMDKATDPSVGR